MKFICIYSRAGKSRMVHWHQKINQIADNKYEKAYLKGKIDSVYSIEESQFNVDASNRFSHSRKWNSIWMQI